jgi:flagellar basal body-associated protein FliL
VFAPRLLAKSPAAKAANADEEGVEASDESSEQESDKEADKDSDPSENERSKRRTGPVGEISELPATVVDIHTTDGTLRHVKVQLAVELPKGEPSEEFKKLTPFAREALITYLRTQEYDRLSDPKQFEAIRKELENEIIDAVGKKHAKRVLIIDFVVQ